MPLLGVISMRMTPDSQARNRKDMIRVAAAVAGLAAFYALVILAIFVFLRGT
jgi:hypothetical protein